MTRRRFPDLKGLMGRRERQYPRKFPVSAKGTAVRLLTAYGTLEKRARSRRCRSSRANSAKKLLDRRMSGLMSKKIATITRYVPLDDVTLEDCRLG